MMSPVEHRTSPQKIRFFNFVVKMGNTVRCTQCADHRMCMPNPHLTCTNAPFSRWPNTTASGVRIRATSSHQATFPSCSYRLTSIIHMFYVRSGRHYMSTIAESINT